MLPQQDIDNIIHASRACDEGPTQLARRIESAVEAAERERCAKLVAAMDNDYLRTSPCRKALERAAKAIRRA